MAVVVPASGYVRLRPLSLERCSMMPSGARDDDLKIRERLTTLSGKLAADFKEKRTPPEVLR
jgi:hypothetical protein